MPDLLLKDILARFMDEDVGWGDATTTLIVKKGLKAKARILAKEDGVFAGSEEVEALASMIGLSVKLYVEDGEEFVKQSILGEITGEARSILMVERTLLNLLSHMCGVASATSSAVAILRKRGFNTRVAATRKTLPGLRLFEKKAVVAGGGDPHRMDLSSMILIKDNHIALCGSVSEVVKAAKAGSSFTLKVEVEVRSLSQAVEAIEAGADIVMLDNLAPEEVWRIVDALKRMGVRDKVLLEASGGITHENIVEYASTGIDIISMGSLTSSARPIDISLEVEMLE